MSDIDKIILWRKKPSAFIRDIWGLVPQPLKEGISDDEPSDFYKPEHFKAFERGTHYTWQQWLTIRAVEWAVTGKDKKRISIESGHGTGKTASVSWLILWYMFCHYDAIVPCTAPTAAQMHDILWKELSLWIQRMPEEIAELYEWTSSYIRMKEKPSTWFARAKTASKESPEALAGVHGRYVMFVIDEASGVPDNVFEVAEGALTEEHVIVLMISNHTRTTGYFHNSHVSKEDSKYGDKEHWHTLSFNSEQSPIVKHEFVERIISLYGADSSEYRVRVQGKAPHEGALDSKGYVPLFLERDLNYCHESDFVGARRMGVDPAGEGSDTTEWVVRDNYKAMVVASEKVSNEKTIAQKTLTLMDFYGVNAEDVYIDNFGVGANVAKEIALAGKNTNGINVGIKDDERKEEGENTFINVRARSFWKLKNWLRSGGELVENPDWLELLNIRYIHELTGKIKIMSKKDMRAEGIKSPNKADALMLTFVDGQDIVEDEFDDVDLFYEEPPMFSDIGI